MNSLNLFISYSHLDEVSIDEFRKHTSPLFENAAILPWHDRKILAGEDFQDSIGNNLEKADIICLFISADFLASKNCQKEKERAFELKKKNGAVVIPIILAACGWQDDVSLSQSLALPTDGKAINKYEISSDGWNNVYEGLKPVIKLESKKRNAKIKEDFQLFLENTEMLTKAHERKERVNLNDIFIFPDLSKYDGLGEYEKNLSSEKLINEFLIYSKIIMAGENQSGKTTICKKMFLHLRAKSYFPVYVENRNVLFLGKLDNKISAAFSDQYEGISIDEIGRERIIPIIDDFHFAKHKEKIIQSLSLYQHQVIVVDDIFGLNIKDEKIIQSYTYFKIKELNPSLRSKLIEKWAHLTEYTESEKDDQYKVIDKTTDLVNDSLGKVIGMGIMPAYPFFVLTVLSVSETFGKSLDQEITSQGYCYQALIYLYLRKEDVKNEEIDTYINFLTQFAFFIFMKKKEEISPNEFDSFMSDYLNKYNLPIKKEVVLGKLQKTQIVTKDSCGNYSFCYPYLYYYFVAKYLAEHIHDNDAIIESILGNLHKDENSYIAIFISHHSKSVYILEKITGNASSLFEKHVPATLNKNEIECLDNQVDIIVKEVLPPKTTTPEKERTRRLKVQDEADQLRRDSAENDSQVDDDLEVELRRSIKTVEVMGRIIKNRAGSLEKDRLERIFEEGMKVHFRILTSFFEIVKNHEEEVIDFISNGVSKVIGEKEEERRAAGKKVNKSSKEDFRKLARIIFWNTNFFFIYALIHKIVHSLGSDKLTAVIEKVCDKEDTPASFLVKHGILMWYNKNLQIDNIVEKINKDGFSESAKKILKFMIVNHCAMHSVAFREKQKIENKLGIPSPKLLNKSK